MTTVSDFPADIQWRPVVGYEEFYEVSEYGHVRTLQTRRAQPAGKVLSPQIDKHGYARYNLVVNGIGIGYQSHRLVYAAFVGEIQDGMEVDHIDNVKSNNHFTNLQLLTHQENIRKMWEQTGRVAPNGENTAAAKLTENDVRRIRSLAASGLTRRELAKRFGITHVNVTHIVNRKTWKHVG